MTPAGKADSRWLWLVAAATSAVVFALHYAIVIGHFAQGGYILDSGWFAHLMGSGDPWLHGPASINTQSYYNVHISPWLTIVTLFAHALGLDRFTAFALHQAVTFSLFAASLIAIVLHARPVSPWLFAGAIVLALASDIVLEIAGFPHFEMATLAFCTLGAAFALRGKVAAALAAFAFATLVREDGGLYALLFLVLLRVVRSNGWPDRRAILLSWEMRAAVVFGLVAVAMFWVKSTYFPGYPTFASNFSGNNWDHVTPTLVLNRIVYLLLTPRPLLTVAVTVALACFSWRYVVASILISPLIAAHLLAVRDDLAKLPLYYVMVLLVIWVGHFIVAACRARTGQLRRMEAVILLAATIAVSVPVFFAVTRVPQIQAVANYGPYFLNSLMGLGVDPNALAKQTLAATRDLPGVCVSGGVAALLPDDFAPEQVLMDPRRIAPTCVNIFRFIGPGAEDYALAAGQHLVVVDSIAGRVVHERLTVTGE